MSSRLRLRLSLAFALLLLGVAAKALAQDISVSPVEWTDPRDPPEVMPAVQGSPRITLPPELRSAPDPGYIVLEVVLDPKGKRLGYSRAATMPQFLRVWEENFGALRFSPAKREGKPVYSSVTLALIYNPPTASPTSPDAAPRLLEVGVVKIPRPKGRGPQAAIPDEVVLVDATIDATGKIAELRNVPPPHGARLEIAAKNWRFAPARRGGQPVAAEMRLPFVITTSTPDPAGAKRLPPRVTFQARPIYPRIMRQSGIRGEVLVDFLVDIEGRVRNAYVARSLHAAFDDPALDAVRKWRFEPGRVGERPVTTHMQVPIIFELDGGGRDAIEVTRKGDLSKLPEDLRYDTPPKIRGAVRPVFPYSLLTQGKKGKASVIFITDERGRVAQAEVRDASAPEFGLALLAAVEEFVYEPALKGGRPNKAGLGFEQEFDTDEMHGLVSIEDLRLVQREKKKPETIVKLSELDAKLTPVSRRPPQYPRALAGTRQPGEAMVEFLIDEDGRVRLPRVLSATHEAFGYAAVQGISTWRFEPPTRGGRAVVARAQIPLRFNAGDAPASAP